MKPIAKKEISQDALKVIERNTDLFMSCDEDGTENANGDYWIARKAVRNQSSSH